MPTVKEATLAWWEEKQKSIYPHQYSYYRNFLDFYILRFLGDEELSDLTQTRMDSYFTQVLFEQTYRNGLGRTKVAYGKPILQSIFDYAESQGLAKDLPEAELTFRINIKKNNPPVGCDYTAETAKQIKTIIDKERTTLTGLAFGFAWYAGLTREEILLLKWGQLDFENNMIMLADERKTWLEKPLKDLLLAYKSFNTVYDIDYIFTSQKKTRFSGPSLTRLILQARQKHGVEDTKVNLNGLRNNYILNKLQTISTEELPPLAQGLGVSSISLINTFGKLLTPTENKVKGVNAFYQRNIEYWTSQLNQLGVDKETVDTVLNKTFEVIAKALKNGENISIDEFGLFYKKTVSERNKSNISTLEPHKMPNVRHELIFVPYPELLFQINFTEDGF